MNNDFPQLTICSAYHSRESKTLLELNRQLVIKLNAGQSWRWVVADNTPPGFADKIDATKFTVVEGAQGQPEIPRGIRGSYQYSQALNKAVRFATTRFLLVLDSDFYIVWPEWVASVLEYMAAGGLAFFGVPWHPRWPYKYRYFPAVHCLFIDLHQIPLDTLDFLPNIREVLPPKKIALFKRAEAALGIRLPWRVGQILKVLNKAGRDRIGASRDCAWPIYRRYAGNPAVRFECLTPVFDPRREACSVFMRSGLNRFVERFLPDRFCYIPKRPGYYSRAGFSQLGHESVRQRGWEEFLWQGRPFGWHVRGSHKLRADFDEKIAAVKKILVSLAGELV